MAHELEQAKESDSLSRTPPDSFLFLFSSSDLTGTSLTLAYEEAVRRKDKHEAELREAEAKAQKVLEIYVKSNDQHEGLHEQARQRIATLEEALRTVQTLREQDGKAYKVFCVPTLVPFESPSVCR